MINIKTKIVDTDEEYQYIEIKKYKVKNTTTAEHLCLINTLVDSIIENDEDMSINKICKLIKENYNNFKKDEEEK